MELPEREAGGEMPRTMLPPCPTPLLGRERELTAIERLLSAGARLLTLTGPPGIGKSRLALEAAVRSAGAFPLGAALVDLVPIGEPARVMLAVAQALGIRDAPDRLPLDRMAEALGDGPFLLVLDNFEHLLDASPHVGELLTRCPALVVIATSRIPLHLAWEQEVPVPPLPLPDPATPVRSDALAACPSVALFLARARAVAPDFELTAANARTIAEICVRLDGLPLAIELAAPRVKLLPPQALLERLEHRLDFLRRVGRDLPERHWTLRAAIGWSYALLRPHEQGLLRRLAVFVGGFTLEAAESVCWSADQPCEAMEALDALVDASLVSRDPTGEDPRYRMLETVREFAAEQLAATGELARTRRHHAAFFLAMAEHAAARMHGPEEPTWLGRLDRDHDNLRAVLAWTLSEGEGRAVLRLAVALWWFWYVRGHLREGRAWLEAALAAATGAQDDLRAKGLYALGVLAWRQADLDAAADLGEQSLRIARAIGDRWNTAMALFLLEMVWRTRGDYVRATAFMEESLHLFREVNDGWGVATALLGLGTIMRMRGEHARAAGYYDEALRLFIGLQDRSGVAASLYSLGLVAREQGDIGHAAELAEAALGTARMLDDLSRVAFAVHLQGLVARDRGDYARAAAALQESLAVFDRIGDVWGVAYSLGSLGILARLQGDLARAEALLRDSLSLRNRHGDRWGIAESLEGLGVTAVAQGQSARAARFLGAAEALRESLGTPLRPTDRTPHERAIASARAALGKRRFEEAWASGRRTPVDALVEEACRTEPEGVEPKSPSRADRIRPGSRGAGPLSAREMEVARLIAQGKTNREIASSLYVTPGTVASHVQHILSKLGFNSRTQIAAWASAPREGSPSSEPTTR